MGLGKTLSVISLIVTNYKDGQPLVTIDKESSVQQKIVKKVLCYCYALSLKIFFNKTF